MIAIDTNVALRYLIADDPLQTPRATSLLAAATERNEPVFLSQIVLCEIEWVLDSTYGASRQEIHAILKRLLANEAFAIEAPERVRASVERYGEGRGDLSDYLLGAAGQSAGATTTFTFDRHLRREPGFTFL
jgi:predicted nucleic-acid-binding protein